MSTVLSKLSPVEYHYHQLGRHCRICSKLIIQPRGKKTTTYQCITKKNDLATVFRVDIRKDSRNIHPDKICNTCNTKIIQLKREACTNSALAVFEWKPHADPCEVCSHFKSLATRGRPQRTDAVGRRLKQSNDRIRQLPAAPVDRPASFKSR